MGRLLKRPGHVHVSLEPEVARQSRVPAKVNRLLFEAYLRTRILCSVIARFVGFPREITQTASQRIRNGWVAQVDPSSVASDSV